ncbi:hypothetical protein T265_12798 [Opisthorchis viverrini]|uniref:Phosphate transporter n=1 Tax=Opisthorchis viverrini TaxID=6198 RepID=A0A074ZY65_OPIVI|nr:hypothetical protein T265_12798 [Opisthorchis viverrini]KER32398.1 hypothetical protein T265_12798 [Opisthorchis viverrini]
MLIPEDQIWMVVVGFIVAFLLAFGIGANDVANSFGTSVGAKVLTLRQACILATICELSGAILLGSKVANTIRKGIVDVDMFVDLENGPAILMVGQVASLCGSCVWLLVATFFRLPVSGTHSIVGATVGFSLVVLGIRSVKWIGLVKIVVSWFISPLLSGLASVGMYYLLYYLVLSKEAKLEPALRLLPAFYGTVILVNSFSIFYEGPPMLHFDRIPLYGVFILSCGCGVIAAICIKFILVPRLRRRVLADSGPIPIWKTTWSKLRPTRVLIVSHSYSTSSPGAEVPSNQIEKVATSSLEADHSMPSEQLPPSYDKQNDKMPDIEVETNTRQEESTHVLDSSDETGKQQKSEQKPRWPVKKLHPTRPFPSFPGATEVSVPKVLEIEAVSVENSLPKKDAIPSNEQQESAESGGTQMNSMDTEEHESYRARTVESRVFSLLQIVTAVFGSFAHGGNDVSNAIGPLIGLWIVGVTQTVNSKMPIPLWILIYGGFGIAIGLWIWGRRVIQTLGEDLTQITPSTGVCIEIGAALTVLIASKVGLPISTTHCKVGSVVGVGRAKGRDRVNWGIFRNILIAWLVTVPASGLLSALLMYGFNFLV